MDVASDPRAALPITGERTVPGVWHENYWFRRHEAVYVAAAIELGDAVVLEAGCGEGYGAQLLAKKARRVVAMDYDEYAIAHVGRAYPALIVVRGNLVALPYADDTYDVVVSLQTVEHLWDQDEFVAECRRVLRPGGQLILSTPNRLTFPPGNWYHTRELTTAELTDLVADHLRVEQVAGLWHGPRLTAWESEHGSCVTAQLAGPPETWPPGLTALVRSTTYADFTIRPADDTALDLLLVAVRGG